jgi:spore maturation protein CgeB
MMQPRPAARTRGASSSREATSPVRSVFEFFARRQGQPNSFFPAAGGGSNRTVMISSYIWWTELIAFALTRLGYNVLVAEPWYLFFTDDQRFVNFDNLFHQWVQTLKKFNVQLVIGGNTTVMVPNPRTKELLHRAAGIPAVNYGWDEPRSMAPMTRRGLSASDYLACLRDERTLNVFWDADVMEEVRRFLAIDNVAHVPLGTTPEFWQTPYGPLKDRGMRLCFLGNNHVDANWLEGHTPETIEWAERVAKLKLSDLDRSTADVIEQVGGPGESRGSTARRPYELAPTLKEEFLRWNILGGMLLRDCRNTIVKAAAERLGDDLVLVGKGWERLGLRAQKDHSGVPNSREYYANSQASLNLFGGCVHGGMPLRPYEIACSGGLLFTQYSRELPDLFEPGKECVAFRNADEMLAAWDRIERSPAEFDPVVENGRRRAIAEHTWEKRMQRILDLAKERFDLPW